MDYLMGSGRMFRSARRMLDRMRSNEQGVAAIEFAFIAPLVFTLFVGAVEVSQAFTVDRRVMQVATTTGDLVARADGSITQSEMTDIMAVGSYIMLPYSSNNLEMTIRNVTSSPSSATTTKQSWYCTYNSNGGGSNTCACTIAAYTLPSGLVSTNDSVVVAEVRYFYTPLLFDSVLKRVMTKSNGAYTLTKKSFAKPRSNTAMYKQSNGTTCASPTFP